MSKEPSMEEILSSIRRVMAREDAESTVSEKVATLTNRSAAPNPFAAAVGDETDAEPAQAEEFADQDNADDEVLELTEESAAPAVEAANATLVSDDRIAASRSSLTQLAEMVKPAPRPDMVMSNISLDEMVQDAIKPMLKTWLDENLPDIVERMVACEISRIVGR